MPPCSGGRSGNDGLLYCAEQRFQAQRAFRRPSESRPAPGHRSLRCRRAGPAWPTGCDRRMRNGPTARRLRPTQAGNRGRHQQAWCTQQPAFRDQQATQSIPAPPCARQRARGTRPVSVGTASAEAAEEARARTGVAGTCTFLLDLEQQRVSVTIVERFFDELAVTACVTLTPEFLTAA